MFINLVKNLKLIHHSRSGVHLARVWSALCRFQMHKHRTRRNTRRDNSLMRTNILKEKITNPLTIILI